MSYPVTPRATFPPGKCIVTGDFEGPFFDFGSRVTRDPRVYVHTSVIEACARKLGMVPKEEVEELREQLAALDEKYAALDRYREAVEGVQSAEEALVNG